MKKNILKGRSRGQSTVELLISLFAFITIFFMFVQVGLSFAVANYVQYATFMSARALLAGHRTLADQKMAAQTYLTKMLGADGRRFGSIAQPDESGSGDFPGATIGPASRVKLASPNDSSGAPRDSAWEQGVSFRFKTKLYMAPMVPGVGRGEGSKVTLESQSWLGRDPSEQECVQQMSSRLKDRFQNSNVARFDNGC